MSELSAKQKFFRDQIILCSCVDDREHLNNPSAQIQTLALMVNGLLENNQNGQYNELIGFYGNVGRSLKVLVEILKAKQDQK